MTDYVVCGWYTPDYAIWAVQLRQNLDRLNEPHDFVPVNKSPGGWEANTMRKATQIRQAMHRNRGKIIVFLDVDCEVMEPLATLADIHGDIAVHMRCKFGRSGLPRVSVRSGTMVLRPTLLARTFVDTWADVSARAPKGCVDQRTLPMAMTLIPGLSVNNLDVRYCAVAGDQVKSPAILHDSASKALPKRSKFMRQMYARFGIRSEVCHAA